MSVMKSSGSYKLRSLVAVFNRYRVSEEKLSRGPRRAAPFSSKIGYGSSGHRGLRVFCVDGGIASGHDKSKDEETDQLIQPSLVVQRLHTAPPKPSFQTWFKWILGSILSVVLPFWTSRWASFLMIKGEVETVVEEVENVVEVVEKVAVSVEKAAAQVADKLPENGKLKEAALLVEHVSSVTVKDAEYTEDLIHKVEKLEHDLTDLETMVEPIIDKIIPKDHRGK